MLYLVLSAKTEGGTTMQNRQVPEYLKSTLIMIQIAFPNGVNREQYFSLLYLLYDYMCDENLAIVMAYVTGKNTASVTNDIWGINQRIIDNDCLLDAKNRLLKSGFASWISDS